MSVKKYASPPKNSQKSSEFLKNLSPSRNLMSSENLCNSGDKNHFTSQCYKNCYP